MTLPQLLAAMRALAGAATPGPWTDEPHPQMDGPAVFSVYGTDESKGSICDCFNDEKDRSNAAFIAMANPQMVAALVRVAEEADKIDTMMARLYGRDWTARNPELREALAGLEGVGNEH